MFIGWMKHHFRRIGEATHLCRKITGAPDNGRMV
jgi:hypothetical protein